MRGLDAEHVLACAIRVHDGRAELQRDPLGHCALPRRDDAPDRDERRGDERSSTRGESMQEVPAPLFGGLRADVPRQRGVALQNVEIFART